MDRFGVVAQGQFDHPSPRESFTQHRRIVKGPPQTPGLDQARLSPPAARWDTALGEYILDWDEVRAAADPRAAALEFARTAFRHACQVCGWDADLSASAEGRPPPVS